MKNRELEKWIVQSAQHIKDTRKHKAQFEKTADEYVLVKSKLDQAEHHLRMLLSSLQAVHVDMHHGKRWSNFNAAAKYVRKARESAAAALAPLDAAKVTIRREPTTRLLEEQKTAVRLAAAVIEPRKRNPSTRDVAKAIMAAAGINPPDSDTTISTWLKEIRTKSDTK